MNKNKQHSGQIALVMVLIMTVVSALAVSVASRSTTETRVQQLNIENTEAILTAQAGLEEAILKNTGVTGAVGEGKKYEVTVSDTGSTGITTEKINPGETIEVNLSGFTGVTGVNVYWKAVPAGANPSIFVTRVGTTSSTDYAYDRDGSNGFTGVSSGGSFQGVNYTSMTPSPIPLNATTTQLRITVLSAPAFIGIQPIGGVFPAQAKGFKSVADLTSDQANVKYGIEYVESNTDQLPSVFDYALFSGGAIQ